MVNDGRGFVVECARGLLVPDAQAQVEILAAPEALVEAAEQTQVGNSECSVCSPEGANGSLAWRRDTRVSEQITSEAIGGTSVLG
jgi:hypothetical protein